jgi:hypothetical protein
LIDIDIYRRLFAGMLGGYDWTGQLYVSLCAARTVARVVNWPDAATQIGLPPESGARVARAASSRMLATPQQFSSAVGEAVALLPPDRDFRSREARVRALANDPEGWHRRWRTSLSPARRASTLPYALTWMWCDAAQGCLDLSPAWNVAPSRRMKAGYRAFRDKLPRAGQDSLRRLVLTGPPR